MDIEIIHNPLSLPIKRLLSVSCDGRIAKNHLDRFIDDKLPRGYRLRVIPVKGKKLIEISSRKSLNVDMGEAALRAAGLKPKAQPYVNHIQILKQLAGRKE